MIALLPGFPLDESDYRPLLAALPADLALTVAHSLGALTAVAEPRDGVTVLLAPSTPRRRPLRPAVRVALRAASAARAGSIASTVSSRASQQRSRHISAAHPLVSAGFPTMGR